MRKSELLVGFLFSVLILLSFSTRNVSAQPSVSILIGTVDGTMWGTDCQATFLITVVNSGLSDYHVFLTLEIPVLPSGSVWESIPDAASLPPGWTYSFSTIEFDVGHGSSKQSTLTITGAAGTVPGSKPFTVIGYWVAHVIFDPEIQYHYEAATVTRLVTVMVKLMVPEYFLGTILGLVGMFAAFGAYYFPKRKQFSP